MTRTNDKVRSRKFTNRRQRLLDSKNGIAIHLQPYQMNLGRHSSGHRLGKTERLVLMPCLAIADDQNVNWCAQTFQSL